ncbi:DUF2065 family protein [Brachymonas sp. G13]|uniref:DUF2065 domain-containing protein n=1 Tax=Brachymonas TaxID=28219 RepID=UPI00169FF718|nr:DUF2065 family protein [Brachymonas sp. J145]MEE1653212.1 DUF2065 family protein [Brachymonas sp. J145]NLX16459.1 DUF2065 domain-containing protein [Ramlibacter sp.]
MDDVLWLALAFMLMFEGLFPLLLPRSWRETFQRLVQLPDQQIRLFGFASVAAGLLLYWLIAG